MSSQLMNASEVLEVGQTIRLHSADRMFEVEGKITEIETGILTITMKMLDRDYVSAPQENQTLFASASGGDCVYRFLTQFRSLSPLPKKEWYVDAPDQVQRQQKRQFVRVPILGNLPLRVKYSSVFGRGKAPNEVTLFDLSGNGVCVISNEEIPAGETIEIHVEDLPGYGILESKAVVRRCTKVRVLDHVVYHIGAHMENSMTEGQRDRLVQSLVRLQQMYLKKGVGV